MAPIPKISFLCLFVVVVVFFFVFLGNEICTFPLTF